MPLHFGDGVISAFNLVMASFYIFILAAAAVSDFRSLRIPNWTSASLFCLFLIYSWTLNTDLNLTHHIAVAIATFVLGVLLYAVGWLSAGDVKLGAAAAVWAGPTQIFPLMVATTAIGGLLAIAIIVLKKAPPVLLFNRVVVLNTLLPRWAKHGLVPYGLAIVGGALWLLPTRF